MSQGLSFSYDDLIQKAEGIRSFTNIFNTQLGELTSTASDLSNNYQSEDANKIVNAIQKVETDGEDFKEAIRRFADVISEEIAPTYQKIEQETSDAASSYYS